MVTNVFVGEEYQFTTYTNEENVGVLICWLLDVTEMETDTPRILVVDPFQVTKEDGLKSCYDKQRVAYLGLGVDPDMGCITLMPFSALKPLPMEMRGKR